MIIGVMVIEFHCFNLKEKKREELQYCIIDNISYHIQHIFTNFLLGFHFHLFLILISSNVK